MNNPALVTVIAIQAASLVVVLMVLTRRGWWKPTNDDSIDWTTTDGCRACWEYGPYPVWDSWTIASAEQARERHRAQHELLVPIARVLVRVVDRIARGT